MHYQAFPSVPGLPRDLPSATDRRSEGGVGWVGTSMSGYKPMEMWAGKLFLLTPPFVVTHFGLIKEQEHELMSQMTSCCLVHWCLEDLCSTETFTSALCRDDVSVIPAQTFGLHSGVGHVIRVQHQLGQSRAEDVGEEEQGDRGAAADGEGLHQRLADVCGGDHRASAEEAGKRILEAPDDGRSSRLLDIGKKISQMFPYFLLKVKNMDFNGLFGNITSVIELSQRLYDELQETDSIGNFYFFCHFKKENKTDFFNP